MEYPEEDEEGAISVDIDNTMDKHEVLTKIKLAAAAHFQGVGHENSARQLMA